MKARPLALGAVILMMACEGTHQPTGPAAPSDQSKIILDGAHGGNKDFWFLPPMVPLPVNNPDFELGKFNNTLRSSLKIEICELRSEFLNAQGLPTEPTRCIAGSPIKTFAPGTVQLVNLPLRQNGWWTLFGLPPDGFYYVLWDTRQSNLNVNKYYRIKVLIDGVSTPLGIADVDPMANLFQWKYTNTGQVIQLVDDVLLPIPFRVEKGGGSTLCGTAIICASATISGNSTTTQVIQAEGNNGPIAGVVIPPHWLPPGSPDNVVISIRSFDTGFNDVAAGTQEHPCHAGLQLEQFNGCFTFTTIPALPQSPAAGGHQFLNPATVVACFVLHDAVPPDPRAQYVQLWASGPNEPAHPLPSVSDALVLTAPTEHNCGSNFAAIITSNSGWSGKLAQFASAGWQKFAGGVGKVFGVKTAYAIDLGLGGFTFDFSNVGPVLTARLVEFENSTTPNVLPGGSADLVARIVGTVVHSSTPSLGTGIPGLPVTFAVTEGNGLVRGAGSEADLSTQATVTTNTNPIDPQSQGSGGGFAGVHWVLPQTPGTYTMTVSSPAAREVLTYHAVVRPLLTAIQGTWQNENVNTQGITTLNISVEGSAASVQAFGSCSPTDCDWGFTSANTDNWDTHQTIGAFWDQGFATRTMTIEWLSPTRIKATWTSHFPDTPQNDYTLEEFFHPVT